MRCLRVLGCPLRCSAGFVADRCDAPAPPVSYPPSQPTDLFAVSKAGGIDSLWREMETMINSLHLKSFMRKPGWGVSQSSSMDDASLSERAVTDSRVPMTPTPRGIRRCPPLSFRFRLPTEHLLGRDKSATAAPGQRSWTTLPLRRQPGHRTMRLRQLRRGRVASGRGSLAALTLHKRRNP